MSKKNINNTKVILFAVNKKHKLFFDKFKNLNCDIKIVYTKKIFKLSFISIKYLNKVNLSNAIELRIMDFYAKRRFAYLVPKILVKIVYKILAIINYMRYFKEIDRDYNKIVLWNGFTFRQAIAVEIAKLYSIKPIYVENGFLPDRIVIDKRGVNFYNSVPRDINFFVNYKNDKDLPKKLIPRNPKDVNKFSNLKEEVLPNEYIFIPFQVDYDTQIMLFSPWIKNMNELFHIIESISSKLDLNFVFKEHPSSKKSYPKLYEKIKNNPKLYFINSYSTQELIQRSEAVITINSSVGIESLLFYKKVIVLGQAFYKINCITKWADNKDELIKILKNLESWKVDSNLIDNFLKYLYYDYLIEGNFIDYNKNQIQQIKNIICNKR